MDRAEFTELQQRTENFATEEAKVELESDLTLLAVFALENPLREKVSHAVKVGTKGHLTIRMVSGDSYGTAKAVAL
jgi:P-type E1-E2 ATPase